MSVKLYESNTFGENFVHQKTLINLYIRMGKQKMVMAWKRRLCRKLESLIKSDIVGHPNLTANAGKSDKAPICAKMRPNGERSGAIWSSQVISLY